MAAPAITGPNVERAKEALVAESRQRRTAEPYMESFFLFDRLLYPDFAYGHPVIGTEEDLKRITEEDARAFAAAYYVPNNAVLCIAGSFDGPKARELVAKYFETIPRGGDVPAPPPPGSEAPAARDQVVGDPLAPSPAFHVGYRLGRLQTSDADALKIIDILLTHGKSSRLYKRLVKKERIALYLNGGVEERGGLTSFRVFAISPNAVMADLCRKAVAAEIGRLRTTIIPEDELAKAKVLFKGALSRPADDVSAPGPLPLREVSSGGPSRRPRRGVRAASPRDPGDDRQPGQPALQARERLRPRPEDEMTPPRRGTAGLLCLLLLCGASAAQDKFRKSPPLPDPLPELKLPPIESAVLSQRPDRRRGPETIVPDDQPPGRGPRRRGRFAAEDPRRRFDHRPHDRPRDGPAFGRRDREQDRVHRRGPRRRRLPGADRVHVRRPRREPGPGPRDPRSRLPSGVLPGKELGSGQENPVLRPRRASEGPGVRGQAATAAPSLQGPSVPHGHLQRGRHQERLPAGRRRVSTTAFTGPTIRSSSWPGT